MVVHLSVTDKTTISVNHHVRRINFRECWKDSQSPNPISRERDSQTRNHRHRCRKIQQRNQK